ncbi:MAG: HAMP domain-containing protein [Lachnospiraceae bacterium]|jgi:methyl-accepting chemotaxis protein|nr:HAMP domain-containing protein [Lachnospiraceae bacterium]
MKKESNEKKDKSSISMKNSVKTRLILCMMGVAAIPLLIAIVISYLSSTGKAKSDAEETLAWQAHYLEAEINGVIKQNQMAIEALAKAPSTVAYVKDGETGFSEVREQIASICDSFNDGNAIVITGKDGLMMMRSDEAEMADISEREYFQKAMAGEATISEIIVSASTGQRCISIAVPIKDPASGEVVGMVHRNFNLAAFHELLARESNNAFLIDEKGILAAHSQYEIKADDEPQDFSASPYMTSGKDHDVYLSTATSTKSYVAYYKEPITGYTVCVAIAEKNVVSEANRSAMTIVILGIVMMIVVVILSFMLANSFVKPIFEVDGMLHQLAQGRFAKITKFTKRKDEFGQMVRNSNAVIEKLDGIVRKIKDSSAHVGASSEDLSIMANQIAQTTDSVANTVQEIAAGAMQQAKEVQDSAENTGLITDAVENVQGSTTELNDLANRMKEASEASSHSLQNFQRISESMSEKIDEISTKIAATENAVADINERVEGISDIAAQTNLLSLNASIEAARAGEAGRGFAVVAEEIRKLADDSESMASEIRGVMDALLAQSQDAVAAAAEIMEGNKSQQEALSETLVSVEGMLDDIDTTVGSVAQISSQTDTCVTSNRVVSNAMASLSAISQENAASTETTGAAVEELSATVTTLAESADELKDVAKELKEEMEFFQ